MPGIGARGIGKLSSALPVLCAVILVTAGGTGLATPIAFSPTISGAPAWGDGSSCLAASGGAGGAFSIRFESPASEPLATALGQLKGQASLCRVLGSYPRAIL